MLLDTKIGRTQIQDVGQPALYLSCAIFLGDAQHTVLSDETFRLVAFSGQEDISTPFEFQLTLHANSEVPRNEPIVFKDILGCRVSFAVARTNHPSQVSTETGAQSASVQWLVQQALRGGAAPGVSVFSGMAASFGMSEPGVYRMTVRPALWKLTLANRYKVYSRKCVRDAIREVCELHGVNVRFRNLSDGGHYNLATSRTQDWLQAGESDYEFLERLMSKAHLYYAFDHSAGDHTVVFANDTEYPRIAGNPVLRYTHTSVDELGLHQNDLIAGYSYEQTLSQSGVRGAFTRQEEVWEQDSVATYQTVFKPVGDSSVEPTFNLHKVYQYGVNERLATEYATVAAQSLQAAASRFSGVSLCIGLRAGQVFQAVEAREPGSLPGPVRPTLDRQWFVLTQLRHEASQDGIYRNEFVALSAQGPLVQVSVRDTQQGVVLAKVVNDGPGRGQAPQDWRYYTLNNFDPEQSKVSDSGSAPASTELQGVYVRFASEPDTAPAVWVKLAPHMQSAPEIGALVLVSRANDESELPEIQSMIDAPGQMTVPRERWTTETRAGSSFSTAYGDSKSIRYGTRSAVDLAAAIGLVESQYNTKKFREVSYSKGARYSYETSNTGRGEILSRSDSVGSTYSTSQGAERQSWEDFDHLRSDQFAGNSESYSTTTGVSYSQSTVGSQENHHTVQQGSKNYETVNGSNYSKITHGSSETYNTVLGASSSYETVKGKRYSESNSGSSAESRSTFQGMSSSYESYNGGRYSKQTVTGDSESFSKVTGTDKSTAHIAVANRNNATGVVNENTTTGFSFNTSLLGTTTDLRVTLNANQVHATGIAAEVSLYGALYRTEKVGVKLGVKLRDPASLEVSSNGTEIEMTTFKAVL